MGCDLENHPRACVITQRDERKAGCDGCAKGKFNLRVMESPQPGELPVSAPEMRKSRKSGVFPLCMYRAPQDRDLCILSQQSQRCPKEIECDRKRGGECPLQVMPEGPRQREAESLAEGTSAGRPEAPEE